MSALKLSAFTGLEISSAHYKEITDKLYQLSGIYLPENDKNKALLKNRLSRLLKKSNLEDISSLLRELKNPNQDLAEEFVNSLTTNKTDFFREKVHFDFLRERLGPHFKSQD